MNSYHLKVAFVLATALLSAQLAPGRTSELFMRSSPNVIYPVGTTYVYQGGQQLRSWKHASSYEIALAVVGGTVRQGAVFSGFSGTESTSLGGTLFGTVPRAGGSELGAGLACDVHSPCYEWCSERGAGSAIQKSTESLIPAAPSCDPPCSPQPAHSNQGAGCGALSHQSQHQRRLCQLRPQVLRHGVSPAR